MLSGAGALILWMVRFSKTCELLSPWCTGHANRVSENNKHCFIKSELRCASTSAARRETQVGRPLRKQRLLATKAEANEEPENKAGHDAPAPPLRLGGGTEVSSLPASRREAGKRTG